MGKQRSLINIKATEDTTAVCFKREQFDKLWEESTEFVAVIESALVIPMKFTYKMIGPIFNLTYGLTKKSWFSKLQFKNLKIKNSLYDLYYEDTCKISKNNLIAFMKSNSSYELKDTLSRTRAKVLILVGSKERSIMKKSAVKIAELIPNSELEILQGYYHGDISINHADDYVERVKRLVR